MVNLPFFSPIKKKKYGANSMLIKASGPDGLNARVLKCINEISMILAMKEIEPSICVKAEKNLSLGFFCHLSANQVKPN